VASRAARTSAVGSPKSATAVAVSRAPRLARKESQEDMKGEIEAVECEFQYSGVGNGLVTAATAATLALALAMPFTLAVKAFAALLVGALGARAQRRMHCVRAIRVAGDRGILVNRDGDWRAGAVRDGSFVAPWLTIVRWRPRQAWFDHAVLILPGMVRAQEFRRLRVLLRWL
jgi:hypothetical protein